MTQQGSALEYVHQVFQEAKVVEPFHPLIKIQLCNNSSLAQEVKLRTTQEGEDCQDMDQTMTITSRIWKVISHKETRRIKGELQIFNKAQMLRFNVTC